MDRFTRTADIIKAYYSYKQTADSATFVKKVCSFFDFIKDESLSDADLNLLLFLAMEMEVYDEDDLAYAIDEKCKNIILKGEYIPLDFLDQVVIDFDTVLNLNGNKLFSYFQITNGAQVTIKNGGFTAAGDPIIEVCGSDNEERPTVLILENLKIEASRGIQINNDGYTRVEVNNTEMQALSYHGWCLQISNAVEGNAGVDILVDGGDLFSAQGYVIECNGDAEVSIKNAKLGGAAGILMQAGSLTMENTVLATGNNSTNPSIPTNTIAFTPATNAARVILTLGPGNQISSKSSAIFHIVPAAQGGVTAQIAITGGTFITENGYPLFSAPEEIGEIVGISGGSFPGISPEESAALAPCLSESITIDEDGNVAAKPQEPGVIVIHPNEENQTQSNPGTGAPINAIGQWLWSIVCWMHSQVR